MDVQYRVQSQIVYGGSIHFTLKLIVAHKEVTRLFYIKYPVNPPRVKYREYRWQSLIKSTDSIDYRNIRSFLF
jgi:hypothetical protein